MTEQHAETTSAATLSEIRPAPFSELIRLAVAYNDALDRCTQTGGA